MRRKRQIEGKTMDKRQNVRFDKSEMDLIKEAAKKQNLSISQFIANAACDEAEKVLRDKGNHRK